MWRAEVSVGSLPCTGFEAESFPEPELMNSSTLAFQQSLVIHLSPLPYNLHRRLMLLCWAFVPWVTGTWTQVLRLGWQSLYSLSHPLSLTLYLFKCRVWRFSFLATPLNFMGSHNFQNVFGMFWWFLIPSDIFGSVLNSLKLAAKL